MKNLFINSHLKGFYIFSNKSNWKTILNQLENVLGRNQFFFFFDSERGYHLKIFRATFDAQQIDLIKQFLTTLPQLDTTLIEDPLFKNVPQNTLLSLQYIPQSVNIAYPELLPSKQYINFCQQLSAIIIDALNYNDFFIEEKNRINFAIQLIFMALVKANKDKIKLELEKVLGSEAQQLDSDSPLVHFYKNVQKIESEEEIQHWVVEWLAIAAEFLNQTSLQTLVDIVCVLLEIRGFSTQLLLTAQSVLKK
ncbi:hypothetical protein GCM10027035_07400 [Emticicia sediminis]